ncbi:MAG: hypothetical protein ACYTE6_10775 [Planctomycetota bacterium]
MADRGTWTRRLTTALVILVVAGGLALWSSHRRGEQADEVRHLVLTLCDDLAAGRDATARLHGTDTWIAGPLLVRLQAAADLAGSRAGALTVVVAPGDTPEAGTVGREATHTAVIRVDGREVLGLRIVHPGAGRDIVIIGFWSPPPS